MTYFEYFPNVPNAPDDPAVDQPQMQVNTQSIQNLIDVDHNGFLTSNPAGGTHAQVQLFNTPGGNGTIPVGLIGNGYETLYSSVIAGFGQLFYVKGADPTGIQLTGPGTPTVSGNGSTFLPAGLILNWGIYNASGGNFGSGSTTNMSSGESVLTLTQAFPNNLFLYGGNLTYTQSNLPSGTGTLNVRASQISSGPISTLSWQVYCNTNNYLGFVWWALGN